MDELISGVDSSLQVGGFDPLALVFQASWIVLLVMMLLVVLSILSWAVIFVKFRELRVARLASDLLLEIYHEGSISAAYEASRRSNKSPIARILLAVYEEEHRINVKRDTSSIEMLTEPKYQHLCRHIQWVAQAELRRLESRLTFLATTGSATPFIGLFGTVVGIINAFSGIGQTGSASLAVVAPGIAEALIATALGLFAAIPATVFYNNFVGRLRELSGTIELFTMELKESLGTPSSVSEKSQIREDN